MNFQWVLFDKSEYITFFYEQLKKMENQAEIDGKSDNISTRFKPVSCFHSPWKRQKTSGFLTFSEGIEMGHGFKMSWITTKSLMKKTELLLPLNHSLECVPLTISYHLYFVRISKVSSMLHHGSVGRVHSKECYLIIA